VFTESLADHVLVGTEREVTKEQSVGRSVLGVAVLRSTVVGTVLWCGVIARSREVDIGLTTVDLNSLLGLKSGCGALRVVKLNISESLGSASCLVGNNTSLD
jgi:hypothetical protein